MPSWFRAAEKTAETLRPGTCGVRNCLEDAAGKSHSMCAMTLQLTGVGRLVYGSGQLKRHSTAKLCPLLPMLERVPCSGPYLTFQNTTVAPGECLLETLILNPEPYCLDHIPGLWSICGYLIPALQMPPACLPLSCLHASMGLTSACQTCSQVTHGGLWLAIHRGLFPWADNLAPRDAPMISMP